MKMVVLNPWFCPGGYQLCLEGFFLPSVFRDQLASFLFDFSKLFKTLNNNLDLVIIALTTSEQITGSRLVYADQYFKLQSHTDHFIK